ncbi:hypothetical protein VNO77_43724 [Canavalia gladiata]|uniref:Uncharacterized protein n=1 Tax=Canavalia gladiata TaxID=3824 RepID=A0AAN9JXM4_CANGL
MGTSHEVLLLMDREVISPPMKLIHVARMGWLMLPRPTSARGCSNVPCRGHATLTGSQNLASFRIPEWHIITSGGFVPLAHGLLPCFLQIEYCYANNPEIALRSCRDGQSLGDTQGNTVGPELHPSALDPRFIQCLQQSSDSSILGRVTKTLQRKSCVESERTCSVRQCGHMALWVLSS